MKTHYKDRFLHISDNGKGRTNTYKKTDYGYLIEKRTPFISIMKTKLYIYDDGTAKAKCKMTQNYQPVFHRTLYFDDKGVEILGKTTRKELAIWNKLRKELAK